MQINTDFLISTVPSGFGKQYLPNANVFCIQYGAESQSDTDSRSHPGHDERKGEMQVFALRYVGWRDTVGRQKTN